MIVEIVNMHGKKQDDYIHGFWVDRRSPLGNPYRLDGEHMRPLVCKRYKDYFNDTLLKSPQAVSQLFTMVDYLHSKGHLQLLCWCAPKQCHAETIRDWVLKVAQNENSVLA